MYSNNNYYSGSPGSSFGGYKSSSSKYGNDYSWAKQSTPNTNSWSSQQKKDISGRFYGGGQGYSSSKSPALKLNNPKNEYYDIYGLTIDADPREKQVAPLTGSFNASPAPSPVIKTTKKKTVTPDLGSLFLKDTVKESSARLAKPSFNAQPPAAAPPSSIKSDPAPFF